jgi:hypothetical protein
MIPSVTGSMAVTPGRGNDATAPANDSVGAVAPVRRLAVASVATPSITGVMDVTSIGGNDAAPAQRIVLEW